MSVLWLRTPYRKITKLAVNCKIVDRVCTYLYSPISLSTSTTRMFGHSRRRWTQPCDKKLLPFPMISDGLARQGRPREGQASAVTEAWGPDRFRWSSTRRNAGGRSRRKTSLGRCGPFERTWSTLPTNTSGNIGKKKWARCWPTKSCTLQR